MRGFEILNNMENGASFYDATKKEKKTFADYAPGEIPKKEKQAKPAKTTESKPKNTVKKKEKDDFLEGFDFFEEEKAPSFSIKDRLSDAASIIGSFTKNEPKTKHVPPVQMPTFLTPSSLQSRNERKVQFPEIWRGPDRSEDAPKIKKLPFYPGDEPLKVNFPGKIPTIPKKDDFLEGFNYYNEDDASEGYLDVRNFVDDVQEGHDKISLLGNLPIEEQSYKWGMYQYNDRNLTEVQNRYKPTSSKNGLYAPEEPEGRFGIALSDLPEITNVSGKNRVNYIFGLDTKYSDQNGKLQSSTVPNWVFNRDAIKQHNVDMIDKFTDKLMYVTPESKKGALSDIADSLKQNQATRVDESATYFEGKFNSVVEDSFKNKTNRAIAEVAEDIPKIVDSNAMKVLKTGGKAISVAGDVIQIVDTGLNIYDDYQDDGKLGKQTVKEIVGVAGDFGGAALGAKAGAALFGAIAGLLSGGVLAAPAAAVGGIVGGIIGGIWGKDIAEGTFELFA